MRVDVGFFGVGHFAFMTFFGGLLGQERGRGNLREEWQHSGFGEPAVVRWITVEAFHLDGIDEFDILNVDRVVFVAKGALGVVALFLCGRDFAIETAEQIDHAGVIVEIRFGILGAIEFSQENLGKASGGGLKADFGQFRGIVAAQKIEEVLLVEAIIEDGFLLETPFEMAAVGPIGNIFFAETEAGIVESGDDVFIGNAIPKHAVDHVALYAREASDATMAAVFAALAVRGRFDKGGLQVAGCRLQVAG